MKPNLVATDLFADSPFPKVNWGSLVIERQEKTVDDSFEPLSVGQMGVTSQLDSVARPKEPTGRKIVRSGDIVINSRSDRRGASGVSSLEGAVSVVYSVLSPKGNVLHSGFAEHLLKSRVFQDTFYLAGVGIVDDLWTTNFNRMSSIRVPLPPLETQRAIADYLDRETAEVDAMSADLDELETLLTERRKAVVTGTVETLSAKYPTPQLGTLVQMVSGSGFPHALQKQEGKKLPFYKVGSLSVISEEGVVEDDRNTISHAEAKALGARVVPADSVLLAKIGAALLLARFVRNDRPCCIDNNMLALVPTPRVEARYLVHALSRVDINLLERIGPVPTLDLGGLRQHRLPLPPLDEQRRIADEIDRETAEIDAMLADIAELRDLLAERRAAVIAAAVTGQIEVPTTQETEHA